MSNPTDKANGKTRIALRMTETVWASALSVGVANGVHAKVVLALPGEDTESDELLAIKENDVEVVEEILEEIDPLVSLEVLIDPEVLAQLTEDEISVAESAIARDTSNGVSLVETNTSIGFTGSKFLVAALEVGPGGVVGGAAVGAASSAVATTTAGFGAEWLGVLALVVAGAAAGGGGGGGGSSSKTQPSHPTATITMSDFALKIGETSMVTVTFSEAPKGFVAADDLTVENGTLGIGSFDPTGKIYTTTFTPTANIENASNLVSLSTAWSDAAGNAPVAISISNNYTVDTKAPSKPTLSLKKINEESPEGLITDNSDVIKGNMEAGASTEFSIDEKNWTSTYTAVDGKNTIYMRQVDGAGNASEASDPLTFYYQYTTAGLVIDGYVKGAKVYYDRNNNNIQDVNEKSVITDDQGDFKLNFVKTIVGYIEKNNIQGQQDEETTIVRSNSGQTPDNWVTTGKGKIISEGGIDTLTGAEIITPMYATGEIGKISVQNDLTILSPFTTLMTLSDLTEGELKISLGMVNADGSPLAVSLSNYDPIAVMKSGSIEEKSAAENIFTKAQQIMTVLQVAVASAETSSDLLITSNNAAKALSDSVNALSKILKTAAKDAVDTGKKVDVSAILNNITEAALGSVVMIEGAKENLHILVKGANDLVQESYIDKLSLLLSSSEASSSDIASVISPAAVSQTLVVQAAKTYAENGSNTASDAVIREISSNLDKIVGRYESALSKTDDLSDIENLKESLKGVADGFNAAMQIASASDIISFVAEARLIDVPEIRLKLAEDTGISNTDSISSKSTIEISNLNDVISGGNLVYSVNDGITWLNILPDLKFDGSYIIKTRQIDDIGNRSDISEYKFVIDTKLPVAVISLSDSALKVGETSSVTVNFSEVPFGFNAATGLNVQNGSLSGGKFDSTGKIYTATFTPNANIEDASNLISLSTAWSDAAGNAPAAVSTSVNYTIDTKASALPSATINLSDVALKIGETSAVTITFSEAPTGFVAAEDLTVENGSLSGGKFDSTGKIYTATFTPNANIEDASNLISLSTAWSDAAGNAPAAVSTSTNYAVDSKAPIATISLSDVVLKIGETSAVTVTFSEVPTGFVAADDLTVENGSLSGGKFDSTGKIYTATFTPTANIEDASNLISLGTDWRDVAGNAPVMVVNSINYTIDTKILADIILTDVEAQNLIMSGFIYDPEKHVTLDFSAPEVSDLKSTLLDLQKLGVDSVLGKGIITVVMGGMPVAGALPSFEPNATVTLGVNSDEFYELINVIKDDPTYFKNGNVDFLISEAGYADLSDADAFILAEGGVVFSPEVDVRVVVDDNGNPDGTELKSSLVNLQKMGVDSVVGDSVINIMLGGVLVASALPRFESEAQVTLYVTDDELNGFIAAVVDGDIDPLYDVFGQQNIDYIASVDGDFNMDALTYTSLTSHGIDFTIKTSVLNLDGAELNEKFNDDLSGN